MTNVTRREWLTASALGAGIGWNPSIASANTSNTVDLYSSPEPFGYCLNMSTIRGQKLSMIEDIEIAAKAGYHGIEPWLPKMAEFVQAGGSLKDLGKRITDLGLKVPSAIGFAEWIVDDPSRRKKGLENAKRDFDWIRQIGGERMAAPPVGATDQADLNLIQAAERYRELLELGESMGVIPQVEVWGFSKSLNRLGETMLVAMESGHAKACILPDVYHLYKGGSMFGSLHLIQGISIGIFHMNDYPSNLDRGVIKDADRVYPGDGVAPLKSILQTLRRIEYRGMLSLELFNPHYWKQDPLLVAKTGLEKMKKVVRESVLK